MKSRGKQHFQRALWLALAGALTVGLGACDQKASTETTGRNIENDVADANAGRAATAGTAIEDAVLRAKVKSALTAEPDLKALAIDVDVSDGTVTLYGTTNTPAHRDKAAQVALNVEGVRSVANHLILLKDT